MTIINARRRELRAGQDTEAEAFERAERDFSWSVRHEVNKLRADRERAPLAHVPV